MMKSIKRGLGIAIRFWRLAFLILLVQLVFGIIVGGQVGNALDHSIGFSQAGELFSHGFDYAVYQDMSKEFPDALSNVKRTIPIIIIAYLIISIFLQGGLISSIIKSEKSWKLFFQNGVRYYFPFLIIGLLFLVLIFVLTVLLWVPLLMNAIGIVESLASDRLFFYSIYTVGIVYILVLSLLVNASVNSRINYAMLHHSIFSSLKAGFSWTFKKYVPLTGIFIFFGFLSFLFLYFSIKIDSSISMNVWVSFIVTLLFVFFRIVIKSAYYAALMDYAEAI